MLPYKRYSRPYFEQLEDRLAPATMWTINWTVNVATGTYTVFAQAEDSYGVFGDLFAMSLTVQ
jgi:hypothetical protein